jgi:hypothetical protein
MKLLFDTGIYIHAEFGMYVNEKRTLPWGETTQTMDILRIMRKPLHRDPSEQRERDSLFTIGRLLRQGKINAYDYDELFFERWRSTSGKVVNALKGCKASSCEPALRRTKFRNSIHFDEIVRKGGKKDLRTGGEPSNFTQIAFMKWLIGLTENEVQLCIEHAKAIGLTEFETESLRQLGWFKIMCARSGSAENYVDVFHLWTAERNGFDLLTLDRKIKRLSERVRAEKSQPIKINARVFQPSDLLREMSVQNPDPVPIEPNRFYPFGSFDELAS